MQNFFELPELHADQPEIFEQILQQPHVRIERIISCGQTTPEGDWYDQEEHEWVLLLEGEAVLEFENGETIRMTRGSHCHLPPHKKHRVAFTSQQPPCIWLTVYC